MFVRGIAAKLLARQAGVQKLADTYNHIHKFQLCWKARTHTHTFLRTFFQLLDLCFIASFLCLLLVSYFCFIFCEFCVFVLFCVFLLLLWWLFPIFLQVYRQLPPGGNPIAVNKYHVMSDIHKYIPYLRMYICINILYLLYITEVRM